MLTSGIMADKRTGILVFLLCVTIATADSEVESPCSMVSATAASRRFSYSLYNTAASILGPRRNILLSPVAVGMSLSMLSSAATGWSRMQIFRALEQRNKSESPMDVNCLLQAYQGVRYNTPFIFNEPTTDNDIARLRTAARLYGDQSYTFQEDFVQNTGRYGVEMDVVPFGTSTREAERRINGWTSAQTEGNIKQMFKPGTLTPDTILALTCAIFFKGTWEIPFINSSRGNFYLHNGRRRTVDFITSRAPVKYISSSTLKAELSEIPYTSPDGSNIDARLILILPYTNVSLRQVEIQLNDQFISELLEEGAAHDTYLRVPKFTLFGEHKLRFFLKRMGVREIFNKHRARLADSIVPEEGQQRIYLSYAKHKSHFKIDETGTQGSSASFSTMNDTTRTTQEKSVVYDRPFIFLLYDKFTDSIIYFGRFSDPRRNIV